MILLINKIEEFSYKNISTLEGIYKVAPSIGGKFEIYTMNMCIGWIYLLEEKGKYINDEIRAYYTSVINDRAGSMGVELTSFNDLEYLSYNNDAEHFFSVRFYSFSQDFRGSKNINQPSNMKYLPYKTYNNIYQEPLQNKYDHIIDEEYIYNKLSSPKVDELNKFLIALTNYVDWLKNEIYDLFNDVNIDVELETNYTDKFGPAKLPMLLEGQLRKFVADLTEDDPLIDTPFGGMYIMKIVSSWSENIKKADLENNFDIPKSQVHEIIDQVSRKVLNELVKI
jgi:hypothetical protein